MQRIRCMYLHVHTWWRRLRISNLWDTFCLLKSSHLPQNWIWGRISKGKGRKWRREGIEEDRKEWIWRVGSRADPGRGEGNASSPPAYVSVAGRLTLPHIQNGRVHWQEKWLSGMQKVCRFSVEGSNPWTLHHGLYPDPI